MKIISKFQLPNSKLRKRARNMSNVSGSSLIELVVICMVVVIFGSIIFLLLDPVEIRMKARDAKRVSDMLVLAQAIEQYALDNNNTPPDANTTVRRSNQAASGNYAIANGTGWIAVDLSKYIEKIPIDPKNTGTLIYRYYRNGRLYKIDTTMEYHTYLMNNTNDGGNDVNHYEIGTGTDTITIP